MLLEALGKLIDRFLQLAHENERLRENLFTRFVEPTFVDFEAVHTDYLTSFDSYRALAREDHKSLKPDGPLFQKIRNDSIRSQHLRNRIAAIRSLELSKEVRPFCRAIVDYLFFTGDCLALDDFVRLRAPQRHWKAIALRSSGPPIELDAWLGLQLELLVGAPIAEIRHVPSNRWRRLLYFRLLVSEETDDGAKKRAALVSDVDDILIHIQKEHSRVVREYVKLRQKFAGG